MKRLLVVIIIAGILILFNYYRNNENTFSHNHSEKNIQINKKYKRQPASIKNLDRKELHRDQVRFNEQFPPPDKNRSVAALIDQFDNFEQVKKTYKIHNHRLKVGAILLHESDYLTYPDEGVFPKNLGTVVKKINGYFVYSPNKKETISNNNHLYIDQLTWQPTIITGKLFVKYPKGDALKVAQKVEGLGHKVTFHHENIRRYEVQVRDRRKTSYYQREIASKIPGIEVDLELKSYEHSH